MQPSPAELARTLATGTLLGALHLRGHPDRLRVRHATGADGLPLLLTRSAGLLAAALRPAPGESDTAVVLSVDDVPPVAGAPCHGRLWLSGWAGLLAGADAGQAAQAYAEVNPTSDLLDVGHGHALYRLDVAEVRLARADTLTNIDVDDYLAAEPDPLHRHERELLTDLADRRGTRLTDLVAALSGTLVPADCRLVRLDRYGLVLAVPIDGTRTRRLRLAFPRPVADCDDLALLFHAALNRRHRFAPTP